MHHNKHRDSPHQTPEVQSIMLSVLTRPSGQNLGLHQTLRRPLECQKQIVRMISGSSSSFNKPAMPLRSTKRPPAKHSSFEPFVLGHDPFSDGHLSFNRRTYSQRHRHRDPRSGPRGLDTMSTSVARSALNWGFIAICVYYWSEWQAARNPSQGQRRRFLSENFVVAQRNLDAGRWWTLASSALSHQAFFHLVSNMVTYNAFITAAWLIGLSPLSIAAVGLSSAVSCSLAQLADWRKKGVPGSAVGASGLVAGLGGYVTVLAPRLSFNLFLIPVPIPLWVLTPALLAWDMYNTNNVSSGVGHAGHVGGSVCGLALGFARRALLRGL